MDLISIIIPVFNVQAYLPKCLDSVLSQSYKNLEIILVDDGSTDESGKICDEYATRDIRIKVIHKQNSGVSAARNDALKIASGEYIGFVDSDDYIEDIMFEKLYTNLLHSNADVSICGFLFTDENGNNKPSYDREHVVLVQEKQDALRNMLLGNYYAGHLWNKLFRKSLLLGKTLDETVKVYEDMLFCVDVFMNIKNVVFDSSPMYHYVMRNDSAFNSSISEAHYTAFDACKKMSKILGAQGIDLNDYISANAIWYGISMLAKVYRNSQAEAGMNVKKIHTQIRNFFSLKALKIMNSFKKKIFTVLCFISPKFVKLWYRVKNH